MWTQKSNTRSVIYFGRIEELQNTKSAAAKSANRARKWVCCSQKALVLVVSTFVKTNPIPCRRFSGLLDNGFFKKFSQKIALIDYAPMEVAIFKVVSVHSNSWQRRR